MLCEHYNWRRRKIATEKFKSTEPKFSFNASDDLMLWELFWSPMNRRWSGARDVFRRLQNSNTWAEARTVSPKRQEAHKGIGPYWLFLGRYLENEWFKDTTCRHLLDRQSRNLSPENFSDSVLIEHNEVRHDISEYDGVTVLARRSLYAKLLSC